MAAAIEDTAAPPRRLKVGPFLPFGELMLAGEPPRWAGLGPLVACTGFRSKAWGNRHRPRSVEALGTAPADDERCSAG